MAFMREPRMPTPDEAPPGREEKMPVAAVHYVNGAPMEGDSEAMEVGLFGLGCFWGAERTYWESPGVVTTAVGYANGLTPNPTYQELCSGQTGHGEVVRVIFDPHQTSYAEMLKIFWEAHDPTQAMRQGNDVGTQYRSGIYCYSKSQRALALASCELFQAELSSLGFGPITTEIVDAPEFYFAEDYHQQYLAKNPSGYCGLGGVGARLPQDWAETVSAA
ncbi:MAG: peptide-methionine (S)-S-oxide reductase MsrA [Myxococcota bacterium]